MKPTSNVINSPWVGHQYVPKFPRYICMINRNITSEMSCEMKKKRKYPKPSVIQILSGPSPWQCSGGGWLAVAHPYDGRLVLTMRAQEAPLEHVLQQ